MKRRILPLLLSLVLLLSTTQARPARAAGTEPFAPIQTYGGQFTDVTASDWFYDNVAALYSLGLSNGKGAADRFAPDADMTVAEALTMAARLRSLYETGDSETGPAACADGGPWYQPYAAYLKSLDVIGEEFDACYDQAASRAQVAHILARALPSSLFTAINDQAVTTGYASRRYIRDVDAYTPYQQDILTLYRWGILSGADEAGSFLPNEPIQRSHVAAMLTRLAYSDLRITLDWDVSLAYSKAGATMESLVSSTGVFHSAPSPEDAQAIDDNLRYMLSRGERTMSLHYGENTLTDALADQVLSAFLTGARSYVEQGYNEVRCSYAKKAGTLTLTFASSLYSDRMIDSYREATMEAAILVHDQLWKDGKITAAMSDYEKARVYYAWLCGHCRYDYKSTVSSMSHSGYGALVDGLAVCDGYTAAYNLLLKLEGISCSTVSTEEHIWTVAILDGTEYHIDPTWGDRASTVDYQYFAMSREKAMDRFA